jgi:hypothetical protein
MSFANWLSIGLETLAAYGATAVIFNVVSEALSAKTVAAMSAVGGFPVIAINVCLYVGWSAFTRQLIMVEAAEAKTAAIAAAKVAAAAANAAAHAAAQNPIAAANWANHASFLLDTLNQMV